MNWHCLNPKLKKEGIDKPEPMIYIGGHDWHCAVCDLTARFCDECIADIPKLKLGMMQTHKQHFDGLTLRLLCQHHSEI